jgi:hypothetical protein
MTETNSGKWLHHVALLGAAPPAIGDLKTYSEDNESTLELFSVNGDNKNIELLTFTQGEKRVNPEKTTVVEPKPENFAEKAELEALKKQLEQREIELNKIKEDTLNSAKSDFKEMFSKEFIGEKLDIFLNNENIDIKLLDSFKELFKNKKTQLPEGDVLENNQQKEEVEEFNYNCGYEGE